MPPVSKIVAATDFSDGATHALDYAASLASALAVPLHLVYVHSLPVVIAPDGFVLAAMYDEVEVKKALAKSLEEAVSRAREHGAGTVTSELADGQAWSEIIRIAGACGADLIVLGTHGRGGAARLLLGSVADKVVRKATCPVVTVGPRA